jgi:uncharacterized membrane protein YoaK (UPF0700 family)
MPWERRHAFLLGLTGAAGALDALAFLHLGKVFASFQSGNLVFVGLGIGNGNGGLVVRAGAVLVGFSRGAGAGARLVGPKLNPANASVELRVVAIEAALLAVFAALWLVVGTPSDVVRVVLLAIGAAAMGIQASLSMSMMVPNVMTVALTATVAALGQRAGIGGSPVARGDLPTTPLLVALMLTYVVCAVVVAALPSAAAVALIPVGVLVVGVGVDAALHDRLPRPRRTRRAAARGV